MPAGNDRRPRRGRIPAALGLLALLISGCASVPSSGAVQSARVAAVAGGPGQANLQMIPVPPNQAWSPLQVVSGFLTALANFSSDPAAARAYLVSGAHSNWAPEPRAMIFPSPLSPQWVRFPNSAPVPNHAVVNAAEVPSATLTSSGQYEASAQGTGSQPFVFHLADTGEGWRIQLPLKIPLLLSQEDFQRLYTARDLYYLATTGHALVPDPVFVPLQATSADLARQLATALLHSPSGWLAGAVITSFPIRLPAPQVNISSGLATVNLDWPSAAFATKTELDQMMAQVLWTLASPAYAQPLAQSARLQFNGRTVRSARWSFKHTGYSVPEPTASAPLYASGAHGAVVRLTPSPPSSNAAAAASPVSGQAGTGRPSFSRIAVSPDGRYVAGISLSGTSVYYGGLAAGATLASWAPGGDFTSVSWDDQDDLWAAGPAGVWLLRVGANPIALATPPKLRGSVVHQFQVAPDGVRVAMIVSNPDGSRPRVEIGAIEHLDGASVFSDALVAIGPGLTDPDQLTWYDADDLIVLCHTSSGPQLEEVPVDGQTSGELGTDPAIQSVSAAGPDNPIVEGVAHGGLTLLYRIGTPPRPQRGTAGLYPTYPG